MNTIIYIITVIYIMKEKTQKRNDALDEADA